MRQWTKSNFWPYFVATLLLTNSWVSAQSLSNSVFQKHRTEVESSVERGLKYLSEKQKIDGTFSDSHGRSVGIVALVGMAYLSAGHTPGYGEYSEAIDRSIDYILDSQKNNGLLDRGDSGSGLMYAHNIATLFLSEVSGTLESDRQEKLEKVLGKATMLILEAQAVKMSDKNTRGWR
ncbi:MAG: hypothetical protein AAF226_17895 [Verrucomicrobiota bacterium]